MDLPLEMKIEDAMHRIKDLYDKCGNDLILSFSGGKDSTIVAELVKMAQQKFNLKPISFVFANTRLEYDTIVDFVKKYNYGINKLEILTPTKPFSQILRDYGKPAMSKIKSDFLGTYQNVIRKKESIYDTKRTYELVTGKQKNNPTEPTRQKLANVHFNFLNERLEYKISSKCCDILKKKPFYDYYKENGTKGYFTGIRISEGGVRSEVYDSCTSTKVVNGIEMINKMPIFDWNDNDVEEFIKIYNIEVSEAYTKYGLDRTGCAGCPFAKEIDTNLFAMNKYEPKKYKAWTSDKWLRKVYMDLGVELLFDTTYTKEKKKRDIMNDKVRYEMLKKYRPKIAYKWKPFIQTDIFDFIDKE